LSFSSGTEKEFIKRSKILLSACKSPDQAVNSVCNFSDWVHSKTTLGGSLATMAWHVLRLWIEGRPPDMGVAVNILNKQSQRADKGRSSSLGVGRGANNTSP